MSYRDVDTEAYKKYYANKNKKKKSKAKKVLKDEKGTFKWEGVRGKRKKKYLTSFSDTRARAIKDMTSNKAYPLSFGETFRQSKAKGEKTFRWKNKQYHTKTKDELEAGIKEKARFERAAKVTEATPDKKDKKDKKRNIFQKLIRKLRGTNPDGSTRTQAEFEAARDARRKAKKAS